MTERSCVAGVTLALLAAVMTGCGSRTVPPASANKATTPTPLAAKAPPDSVGAATPVLGPYADAVGYVGSSRFPSVFAGARQNPDGSVTAYVGPGSDVALIAALKAIDPASIPDAPSPSTLPALHVVRVPLGGTELERQAKAVGDADMSLAAAGYKTVGVFTYPERGVVEVRFHSVPSGVTVASATAYVESTIAPNVVVTSIDAEYPTF